MFDNLASRLQEVFAGLSSKGRLSEEDVDGALRQIRLALLEADVNYQVAKDFIAQLRERAIGADVLSSLTPGQMVIKLVLDQLTELLGGKATRLVLSNRMPNIIMLVGLQGSGKTTAAAKLALHLRKKGKKPLLVAADVYRPAAIDQLQTLGRELSIPVFVGEGGIASDPVAIAQAGVRRAVDEMRDLVIIDTAGRLQIDEAMMAEAEAIKKATRPDQIIMVLDAMTGQEAVNVAKAFSERLDFDGVLLSKLDGDARGGAALSIRTVAGKPILFASTGEKPSALEEFHPDRMAKRILGMGDMVTLIEQAQEAALEEEISDEDTERLAAGRFTFDDFLTSIKQMRKLGGLGAIAKMLPKEALGGAALDESKLDDGMVNRSEAIIFSMTAAERANPKLLNGSRRARIAAGCGMTVMDVNRLVKQFEEAQKAMKQYMPKLGAKKKRPKKKNKKKKR
ncbi:MAG: signal recognition particle protein [Coriobacteriia bacterium]|nr:signal recognition particle protein [Coriobacteriia bacterium]